MKLKAEAPREILPKLQALAERWGCTVEDAMVRTIQRGIAAIAHDEDARSQLEGAFLLVDDPAGTHAVWTLAVPVASDATPDDARAAIVRRIVELDARNLRATKAH